MIKRMNETVNSGDLLQRGFGSWAAESRPEM